MVKRKIDESERRSSDRGETKHEVGASKKSRHER